MRQHCENGVVKNLVASFIVRFFRRDRVAALYATNNNTIKTTVPMRTVTPDA